MKVPRHFHGENAVVTLG